MAKLANIFETFSIKDSINRLSSKVKDHVGNMVLDSAKSDEKVSLLSEIDVTHACIVNGNFGYYPDDKLKKSVDSWTKPFNKPVLVHHESHKDAVGRNVGSIYRSIAPSILPQVQNSVRDTDFSYRGLGYIRNLVNTTDPDAVAKVLDGRYLTVSVGGETDSMVCSICEHDWLEDGRCEHRFGNTYEDFDTGEKKLAFWQSGNMQWDELSYVNNPADVFAIVHNREVSGTAADQVFQVYNYKDVTVTDSQKVADEKFDRVFSLYAFNDSTKKMAKLSDATNLDALYKVYGRRILSVGADLNVNPIKGDVLENTQLTDEQKAKAIADAAEAVKVKEAAEVEAKKVADAAAETAKVVDDKAKADAALEAAKVTPETPIVKDQKELEDSLTTVKNEVTKLEGELKTSKEQISKLTEELADTKTEKEEAIKQSTSLNTQIRDIRINRLLDLRESLGLASYATEDARKAAFDSFVAQSSQSIEDQLKIAEDDAKKNAKRLPSLGTTEVGSESGSESVSPLQVIMKQIDSMSDQQVAALLVGGKYNPPVMK